MRQWACLPDDGWHLACGSVSFAAAFAQQLRANYDDAGFEARLAAMPDPARAEHQRQILEKRFDAPFVRDAVLFQDRALADIEVRLTQRPWLAGDDYSLAEACITPYLERLDRLGLSSMWEGCRPNVSSWFNRIRARPSYTKAISEFPPATYDDRLVEQGKVCGPKLRQSSAGKPNKPG